MNDIHNGTHHLYFAYGSNMNQGQITSRCFKPEVFAIARLSDHALSFSGYSKRWDGGEATLNSQPGEDLWGVVYKLSFMDSERLDSWQDVRLDGTGSYFLFPTEVIDKDRNTYPVLLYKKFYSDEPRPPSKEYLDTILSGATSHGIPAGYIDTLKRFETKQARFPVPRIFEHERSSTMAGHSSCDCGTVTGSTR
ncbi:MAG: gamma-glutamylcyclotransferase [Geobacteraceae bacterium]|nr:gamma-glutamylcyclotransferase [Geobacteraceae bacterium]